MFMSEGISGILRRFKEKPIKTLVGIALSAVVAYSIVTTAKHKIEEVKYKKVASQIEEYVNKNSPDTIKIDDKESGSVPGFDDYLNQLHSRVTGNNDSLIDTQRQLWTKVLYDISRESNIPPGIFIEGPLDRKYVVLRKD